VNNKLLVINPVRDWKWVEIGRREEVPSRCEDTIVAVIILYPYSVPDGSRFGI